MRDCFRTYQRAGAKGLQAVRPESILPLARILPSGGDTGNTFVSRPVPGLGDFCAFLVVPFNNLAFLRIFS
jgi:hypothetical protein